MENQGYYRTEKVYYDYDGLNLMEEYDEEGNCTVQYIYSGSVKVAFIKNNQLFFYHQDRLGSIIAITGEEGDIIWQGEYFSYGTMQSESSADNAWKFTGQQWDGESGFSNFMRAVTIRSMSIF